MLHAQNSHLLAVDTLASPDSSGGSENHYDRNMGGQIASVLNQSLRASGAYNAIAREAEVTLGTRTLSLSRQSGLRERLREEAVAAQLGESVGDEATPRLDALIQEEERLLKTAKMHAERLRATLSEKPNERMGRLQREAHKKEVNGKIAKIVAPLVRQPKVFRSSRIVNSAKIPVDGFFESIGVEEIAKEET